MLLEFKRLDGSDKAPCSQPCEPHLKGDSVFILQQITCLEEEKHLIPMETVVLLLSKKRLAIKLMKGEAKAAQHIIFFFFQLIPVLNKRKTTDGSALLLFYRRQSEAVY